MTQGSTPAKGRAVGINHVALGVGDIDAALDFYGAIFDLKLRGRGANSAFIDLGDQFIALFKEAEESADVDRHFGLVVEDREAVRRALAVLDVKILPGRGLDFFDPWGNRVQIVEYRNIQFMKRPEVLRAMGLEGLEKTESAMQEIAKKGFASE